MALARVVSFDGVDGDRLAALVGRMRSDDGPPPEVAASELVMLHDAEGGRALAVLFFDSEDDYSRADAALSAMPADETPGRRASVAKYEVVLRRTT